MTNNTTKTKLSPVGQNLIKTCAGCKKDLPIFAFDRDHRNPDDLCTRCRDCRRADRQRRRKSNPYRAWARHVLQSRRQAGFITEITPRKLADLARQTPVCPSCRTVLIWDRENDPSIAYRPHKSSVWTPHLITTRQIITADSILIVCRNCFGAFLRAVAPQALTPEADHLTGRVDDLGRDADGIQIKKLCFDNNNDKEAS